MQWYSLGDVRLTAAASTANAVTKLTSIPPGATGTLQAGAGVSGNVLWLLSARERGCQGPTLQQLDAGPAVQQRYLLPVSLLSVASCLPWALHAPLARVVLQQQRMETSPEQTLAELKNKTKQKSTKQESTFAVRYCVCVTAVSAALWTAGCSRNKLKR